MKNSQRKWFFCVLCWNSGSQTGCRGTLGWRELKSGVPPIINIHSSFYLLNHLGVPRQISSLPSQGAVNQKKGWETLYSWKNENKRVVRRKVSRQEEARETVNAIRSPSRSVIAFFLCSQKKRLICYFSTFCKFQITICREY